MNDFLKIMTGGLSGGTTAASGLSSVAAIPGVTLGGLAAPIAIGAGALIGGAMTLFGGGGGSSGGTGRGEKLKKSLRAEKNYKMDQLRKDFARGLQLRDEAQKLYNAEVKAKNEENARQFKALSKARTTEYNAAVRLYKDSVKAFNESTNLNNISATMAMNDAARIRNERLEEMNNQIQSMMLDMEVAKKGKKISDQALRQNFARTIKDAKLNANGLNMQLVQAIRDGNDAMGATTRGFRYTKEVADKQLEILESEMEVEEQNIEATGAELLGEKQALRRSAENQMQAIKDQKEQQDNELKFQAESAQLETDFALQQLDLARQETQAEGTIQTDAQRRKGLLEQSAQIAKGQAGRSAAKSVQGMAFASEQAQALIASAITRADAKYTIDKKQLVNKLNLTRRNINNQLAYNKTKSESEIERTGIGLNKAAAQMEAEKLKLKGRRLGLNAKKREADIAELTLQEKKGQSLDTLKKTKNKVKDTRMTLGNQLNMIANEALGSQQQFQANMLRGQLDFDTLKAQQALTYSSAQSARQSLKDEFKLSKERIRFDQAIANKTAEAMLLKKPKMPPLLTPPTEIPDLVLSPAPTMDWKKLDDVWSKAVKAKSSYTPNNTAFGELQQSIVNIASAAEQVATSFKQPEPVMSKGQLTQQANSFTPVVKSFSSQIANNPNFNTNIADNGFVVDDFSTLDMPLVSEPRY